MGNRAETVIWGHSNVRSPSPGPHLFGLWKWEVIWQRSNYGKCWTRTSSLATANPGYPALARRGLERKQKQNNWERSKNHRSLMNKAKRLPSDAIHGRQKKKEKGRK